MRYTVASPSACTWHPPALAKPSEIVDKQLDIGNGMRLTLTMQTEAKGTACRARQVSILHSSYHPFPLISKASVWIS
eukprot:1248387-Amphidinium_carterae.1